jgi:hypothetical protein
VSDGNQSEDRYSACQEKVAPKFLDAGTPLKPGVGLSGQFVQCSAELVPCSCRIMTSPGAPLLALSETCHPLPCPELFTIVRAGSRVSELFSVALSQMGVPLFSRFPRRGIHSALLNSSRTSAPPWKSGPSGPRSRRFKTEAFRPGARFHADQNSGGWPGL